MGEAGKRESRTVKVVSIGATEEGRPQLAAIVTSPANHRELAHYQEIARRLALPKASARTRPASLPQKARRWSGSTAACTPAKCSAPGADRDALPVRQRQRRRDAAHPRRRHHPLRPRQSRRHGPRRRLVHAREPIRRSARSPACRGSTRSTSATTTTATSTPTRRPRRRT